MPAVIKIPKELPVELDRLAKLGVTTRAAYAIEVLWREVRRAKQSKAVRASAGLWKSADHPELAEGGAAYVEKLRGDPDVPLD